MHAILFRSLIKTREPPISEPVRGPQGADEPRTNPAGGVQPKFGQFGLLPVLPNLIATALPGKPASPSAIYQNVQHASDSLIAPDRLPTSRNCAWLRSGVRVATQTFRPAQPNSVNPNTEYWHATLKQRGRRWEIDGHCCWQAEQISTTLHITQFQPHFQAQAVTADTKGLLKPGG